MMKNATIGPADKLYNSRIIATYIKFLRKEHDYIDIDDVLAYARIETYQVEDETCWFTQDQVDLFNERVVKVTGKNEIARDAGRFGLSPDSLGFVKSYILGSMSIGKAYDMVAKITPKLVKSVTFESQRLGANKTKIIVRPRPGVQEKLYQCQNRIGYFEATAMLFHQKFPQIEHTRCVFKGDECCEFLITWQEFKYEMWKKIRTFGGAFLLVLAASMSYFHLPGGLFVLSAILATLLVTSLRLWNLERKELHNGIGHLSQSTDDVIRKMEMSIKNMDFARQLVVALSLERDRKGLIDKITYHVDRELDYDRGMIFLVNKEKTNLEFYGGFGYTEKQLGLLRNMNPRLRSDSTGVFTMCFMERKPFLVNDVDEIATKLSPRSLDFTRQMGTKSFISVPIISSNITLGIFAVDNMATKRPLLQSDLDLLMNIAPEIGMAIENLMAAEDKERQFHSILQALASSIDARDPLTAGHSERVTRFAVGIALEMQLPQETVEMIRVAALLHDYGKIGIADSILKKPGKLTNAEYDEIKTHAEKTRLILDKIEFQGIYQEVPIIASSHHEKFNGTGYPNGLHGADIPLGARILAVADVFEAITAKRHYRDPMPLSQAFDVLTQDSGKHFDPEVLNAFMRYYETEGRIGDAVYAPNESVILNENRVDSLASGISMAPKIRIKPVANIDPVFSKVSPVDIAP
jgi:HD-GYP domain-containing protein (c-di-GMP phosphodiesterase class II)